MMQNPKIIIIGGGTLGLSTAFYLTNYGAKQITVIDRGSLFEGASGKCAGIISLQLWNPQDIILVKRSMETFRMIEEKSDGVVKIKKFGLLRTASSDNDLRELKESHSLLKENGVEAHLLEAKEIRSKFPYLQSWDIGCGIFTPGDFYIDPGAYAYALYSYLRSQGVKFLLYDGVREIETVRGKVSKVYTNSETVEGDIFLVSAGAWTKGVLKNLGIDIFTNPYKTQAGVLKARESFLDVMLHDISLGIYLRPETENLILFGDGTDSRIENLDSVSEVGSLQFKEEMAEKISMRLPLAQEASFIRTWIGVCSGTPDRRPILGRIKDYENLFVATGLNGFGFMRSPALGEVMARILLDEKIERDLMPYLIDRFGVSQGDFEVKEGFTPL